MKKKKCQHDFIDLLQKGILATSLCMLTTHALALSPLNGQYSSNTTFSLNFDNIEFSNSQDNHPGYIIPGENDWNLGKVYPGNTASCEGVPSGPMYYSARTTLPQYSSMWYKLNEYLAVQTQIYIASNDDVTVPFSNKSNQTPEKCRLQVPGFGSGSNGKLTLQITKPIIGVINIDRAKIASLYAVRGEPNLPNLSYPLVEIFASIKITSPQSCNFQVGDIITMDFGDIAVNSFTSIGGQPSGVNKQDVNLSFDCDNIMQSNQLLATLRSTPDPDYSQASKSNLAGIGIIAEKNDDIIAPNSSFDTQFDRETNQGSITFKLYPTRTKSKQEIVTGTLNTNLEIRLDIQ